MRQRLAAGVVLMAASLAAAVPAASSAAASGALTGTLYLTAGSCAHGSVSGTYIQMILPSGSTSGPYMSNSDSSCSNQAYTLLAPGKDGGLRFGSYQPLPNPPFDKAGNAQADAISAPAQYEGTAFATSTNPVDPQTHTKVPAPTLSVNGGQVTADLRSFSVSWNNQYFNQGSPKPDGSDPGITRAPTGTYDAATGAMTLSWTSQVVGGPFDKFTGSWHLVGRFVPSGSTASSGSTTHHGGSAAAAAPHPSATATGSAARRGHRANPASDQAPQAAASSSAGAPPVLAATTSVVTKHTWQVSWWLVVLAIVLAVAGFGGLGVLRRHERDGS